MLTLDKRLSAILEEIDGNILADIGCDHGKISIEALKRGKVNFAIASDISQKSLDKAALLAHKHSVNNIKFLISNGFEKYEDIDIDVVVIAGMGGKEIVKILTNAPKRVKKLILVANTDTILLRNFLLAHSMQIDKDFVIQEGKYFYNLLTAFPDFNAAATDKTLVEKEILLGKNEFSNPAYIKYLDILTKRYKRLCESKANNVIKQQSKRNLEIINNELNNITNK